MVARCLPVFKASALVNHAPTLSAFIFLSPRPTCTPSLIRPLPLIIFGQSATQLRVLYGQFCPVWIRVGQTACQLSEVAEVCEWVGGGASGEAFPGTCNPASLSNLPFSPQRTAVLPPIARRLRGGFQRG